jgi:multiple sugar transport system permease protein
VNAKRAGLLFSAPAFLGLALFVALPFGLALFLSLTNAKLGSPLPTRFVGFEQYRRLFADEAFLHALRNNAVFTLAVVPVQTCLALALALLLHQRLKGLALFRTLFFLPVVFPLSLVAVVWVLMFAPGPDGTINALLSTLTFGAWTPRDFLHDPALALPAIMLTSIWQGAGFQMVILLAGLQAIPGDLYEAAAIDGAGRWRRFLHVTLPQLRPVLLFVALVTTILCFRLFDQVQVMTRGGPNDATTTVLYEAVQASFQRQQVARASAMTVVLFLVVLAAALLQRRFARGAGAPRS